MGRRGHVGGEGDDAVRDPGLDARVGEPAVGGEERAAVAEEARRLVRPRQRLAVGHLSPSGRHPTAQPWHQSLQVKIGNHDAIDLPIRKATGGTPDPEYSRG
eukprot:COSAG04_NODE_1209_length_7722_cov_6.080415_5_plen_102_part_00